MSSKLKLYLGNLTDKDVLVGIGADTYVVKGRTCPCAYIETQVEPVLVKIGFESDAKTLAEKEFEFEDGTGVIRFCEYEGTLSFCEIETLEPALTLKLIN